MTHELQLTGRVIGDLKPGDVVVVSVIDDAPLTADVAAVIKETVMAVLPDGVQCVVTTPAVTVDVLRPQPEQQGEWAKPMPARPGTVNPDGWAIAPFEPYVVLHGGHPLLEVNGHPWVFHGKEAAELKRQELAERDRRREP